MSNLTVYIGSDHRGFALKERIRQFLEERSYAVEDMGAATLVPDDDYPRYAHAVAEKVAEDPSVRRGIVACGSGFGVDITANKSRGVRSALAMSPKHITEGRHDDDVNVLALAADFVDEATALAMVEAFLSSPFEANEARYVRRIQEVQAIERGEEEEGENA